MFRDNISTSLADFSQSDQPAGKSTVIEVKEEKSENMFVSFLYSSVSEIN